jgi:hypothetical protein
VEFNGNVTTGAIDLHGNVTLNVTTTTQKTVTLNANNTLTLGADKTISVRIRPTAAGSTTTTAKVLSAGPGRTFLKAGGGNVVLATTAAPRNDDAVNGAKKLTVQGQALTIFDGTLQVVSGAVFDVNNVSLVTHLATTTEPTIGYLAVADGGTLSLTGAGAGVNIGATTITGTASAITAAGGTVSLGNDKITGAVAGSKLTVTKLANFTVNGGVATGGRLTLEQVDLNLIAAGTIRTGNTIDQVELTKRAKITLKDDTGGAATERTKIGATNNWAQVDGDFVGLYPPTSSNTQAVLSVAHNGGSPVIIKGGSVTLSRSGTNFIQ